jgi:hypothetical protein
MASDIRVCLIETVYFQLNVHVLVILTCPLIVIYDCRFFIIQFEATQGILPMLTLKRENADGSLCDPANVCEKWV